MEVVLGVLAVSCCCSSILTPLYLYPIPTKTPGDGYTQIAYGRVPLNNGSFKSGKADKDGEELCKNNCNVDSTCKGFATWRTGNDINCYKYKTKPNAWLTVNQYLTNKRYVGENDNLLKLYFGNKGDAKIFTKQ